MAYNFYQTTKNGNKYVLKEKFVEFQEISAINKYNEMFNRVVREKLSKHKSLQQAIEYVIWNISIKKSSEEFDLVPEYIQYIVTDLFDIDSSEIKKMIREIYKKYFTRRGAKYYRNLAYVK